MGLRERFAIGEQALQALEPDTSLLHGNLGWRNLGIEHDDGQLILFDFEHAAIGAPILDLAKLWDRELANPEARSCFLAGYQREGPESYIQSWHAAIDIVRLWAVAGMFTYTRKHTDPAFERHARSILRQLSELPYARQATEAPGTSAIGEPIGSRSNGAMCFIWSSPDPPRNAGRAKSFTMASRRQPGSSASGSRLKRATCSRPGRVRSLAAYSSDVAG